MSLQKPRDVWPTGPLVTVYVPCRAYGKYLAKAVESLWSQIYPNWELFIVDDGSEDETGVIARHLQERDPERVNIVVNEQAQGLQRIANKVLDLSHGRYIVRLDADDWFEESALLLMVAKLESDSSLALVYGNYFYTDQEGQVIGVERRRKLGVEDVSHHTPPHGACTMVRTTFLKAVGGYSEDVDAQDGWELWYKLIKRGRAANLEAPLFYYRQHNESVSRDSKRLLDARAKILSKLRSKLEGSYVPSCLAVIPIRESFPGFEGIPYQEIDGHSLLEIAIRSAQGAQNVTAVAVTSSSEKVQEFSRALVLNGKVREHMQVVRPAELAGPQIQMRKILLHCGEVYKDTYGSYPDIILFLSLHAPLRESVHVDKAIDVLRVNTCDSVVSVNEEREAIFRHGRDGLSLLNPGRFDDVTYDREQLYRFNGAIVAIWWEVLRNSDLLGKNVGFIEMSSEASLQVKTLRDLRIVENIRQLTKVDR